MTFFKDDPALNAAAMAAPTPVEIAAGHDSPQKRLAATYNRIGGLLESVGRQAGIRPRAAVAVWQVESGGMDFVAGRPVLRFENHKFFANWGKDHIAAFDRHFQFGGRDNIPGRPWTGHKWRPAAPGDWRGFHGDQASEYEVLAFARSLGNDEAACRSASFGGPQILGENFARIGYGSATELFSAFAQSERWQVCGFFDFCQSAGLLAHVRNEEWLPFAAGYNGGGQAESYGAHIKAAFDACAGIGL
jgi:hypothetical protein